MWSIVELDYSQRKTYTLQAISLLEKYVWLDSM